MKKLLLLVAFGIFVIGCSSKEPVKQNPSVEMQKYDAQKEWKELDNQ